MSELGCTGFEYLSDFKAQIDCQELDDLSHILPLVLIELIDDYAKKLVQCACCLHNSIQVKKLKRWEDKLVTSDRLDNYGRTKIRRRDRRDLWNCKDCRSAKQQPVVVAQCTASECGSFDTAGFCRRCFNERWHYPNREVSQFHGAERQTQLENLYNKQEGRWVYVKCTKCAACSKLNLPPLTSKVVQGYRCEKCN
jgi:hypothetical protein